MSEFYRMNPARWNNGTADLSLEQEAAFLRIINAIHLHDEPLIDNDHVLAGLFRCDVRKARHLKNKLIEAGKIVSIDGRLHNDRAATELEHRHNLSTTRGESGRLGGEVSGRSRRDRRSKSLKSNETGEAIASSKRSRIEENRIEEYILSPPQEEGHPSSTDEPDPFDTFWSIYPRREDKIDARKAWTRATKSSESADIIAAAKRYAAECQGKERQFVKLPATWLNKGSWLNYEQQAPPNGHTQFHRILAGTPQWDAWLAYREAKGEATKFMRMRGEWQVPSEWPPKQDCSPMPPN